MKPKEPIRWSVVWAIQGAGQLSATPQSDRVGLQHIRELRGRVLHAEGRRNGVLRMDRKHWDGDVTDLWAHHLVGHCGGQPVACARLFTLSASPSVVEAAVTTERFEAVLEELQVPRHRMGETSRWVVAPEYPGAGMDVVLGVCALARSLGLEALVGMISTQDLDARRWIHLGARAIDGDARTDLLRREEEIRPVQWDLRRLPATVEAGVADMARTLGLELARSESAALGAGRRSRSGSRRLA